MRLITLRQYLSANSGSSNAFTGMDETKFV
jgi:secreted Zn-dependent insulinase-like peptidase